MINSRKRHIQNGCCSRSTAFNFPPSFYAYGIRISKGKRWKLLETSSRGRSNYKDGLKPRDLAFRWLFPDISWNCCNWYPKLVRSIHFSRMGRGGQTLFLDSGHSQFGSGAESDIERWWKIGSIFPFVDIIFALFVGQVNATSTSFHQRDTRIKRNLIN